MKAIDLFCGLGGWTEGLLAEGYDVTGYDIDAHEYGEERYPAKLVLQDVLTLDGAQFADAALIVASPPCQEFSYMAMPWRRAKQIARALRGEDEFPEGYKGSRTIADLTALFDACFRIQAEASAAAGRKIPLVVENVRGAEPWVGRARWSFGSYYLWGDVPALMPTPKLIRKNAGGSWFAVSHNNVPHSRGDAIKNPGFRFDGSGRSESVERHVEGRKRPGLSLSEEGFNVTMARQLAPTLKRGAVKLSAEDRRMHLSSARKAASAKIAKIPFALSSWIARAYKPASERAA